MAVRTDCETHRQCEFPRPPTVAPPTQPRVQVFILSSGTSYQMQLQVYQVFANGDTCYNTTAGVGQNCHEARGGGVGACVLGLAGALHTSDTRVKRDAVCGLGMRWITCARVWYRN